MTSHAVAPNSVHIWRGFKNPKKTYADFSQFLGSVFVPACALLQPNSGLRAYIPSMSKQEGKPPEVPDQTALMFWNTPETHKEAFKTLAVRSYTNLHGVAYGAQSKSGFPIPFTGKIKIEQPYYLINQKSDWMLGGVRHLIGSKPPTESRKEFVTKLNSWATQYYGSPPKGIDGALLCVGKDYVIFWEHWEKQNENNHSKEAFSRLKEMVVPFLTKEAKPFILSEGLWDPWSGIDLAHNDCINIQFSRVQFDEKVTEKVT